MTIAELLELRGWISDASELTYGVIRAYQKFHGLVEDGQPGPVTTRSLMQPRICGLPDTAGITEEARRGHGKSHFKWWQDNSVTTLNVSRFEFDQAMAWAFAAWHAAGVGITGEPTTNKEDADLHVYGVNMGGPGGVLADSTLYALPGRHRYDNREPWSIAIPAPPSKIQLKTVIAHELGHFLGARHIPSGQYPGQLMNPIYDPSVPVPQEQDTQVVIGLGYPRSSKPNEPDNPTPKPPPEVPSNVLTTDNFHATLVESLRRFGKLPE